MSPGAARYFHSSNLLSYLSLLAGLIAIISSYESKTLGPAGALIAFCALADLLDGKFASRFARSREEKAFGLQLDSLVDAIVFGLAPIACFYSALFFTDITARVIWLAAAFFYLLCAVTRLGAYNVESDHSRFIGVPTTLAGLIWSSFFFLKPSIPLSIALLIGCGLAMVSPIRIARPKLAGMALILGWTSVLIIAHGARSQKPAAGFLVSGF
jgi:CDP-diacylglycerol--serine O-phosphatidyltransferase